MRITEPHVDPEQDAPVGVCVEHRLDEVFGVVAGGRIVERRRDGPVFQHGDPDGVAALLRHRRRAPVDHHEHVEQLQR
jgi:hypothetical protein